MAIKRAGQEARRRRFFLFTAFLIPILFSASLSQETRKTGAEYHISVTAVSIAVTVQDKAGRYVNDLTVEDFAVYEDGRQKEITYFRHDFLAPLSLTILLDVSGSMALEDKLLESKEGLRYLLLDLLRPEDEVSLLIFADGDVEVASKYSKDKNGFLAVLDKTEAYGQTALYDAVAVSPEFANRGRNEKRALVLITDGIENDSRLSPAQAVEIARKVDVPIHVIAYKIPLSERYLMKHKKASGLTPTEIVSSLERFSQATGGKNFFVNTPGEICAAFREIHKELGHQYLIGYSSTKDPEGDYRKIKVVTSNKNYRVRTKEGY